MDEQRLLISSEEGRARAVQILSRMPLQTPVVLSLKPYKERRSQEQNRLYWVWMGHLAQFVRNSTGQQVNDDDMHEYCKDRFLHSHIVEIGGEFIRRSKTTTRLSIEAMTEYLTEIDAWAAELGCILPDPEQGRY
jgi:hypothetical protein